MIVDIKLIRKMNLFASLDIWQMLIIGSFFNRMEISINKT